MKLVQIAAMATLTLGLTQLAYANHHEGADGKHCARAKHSMQDSDTNKDGAISRDEFMGARQTRAEKHFAKMDANSDGKIEQAERDAMKAKWKAHHQKPEAK